MNENGNRCNNYFCAVAVTAAGTADIEQLAGRGQGCVVDVFIVGRWVNTWSYYSMPLDGQIN